MRFTLRDLVATVLVVAVVVPYVGYLVRGEMPFIEDPRGMAAVGLVLGFFAFVVARSGDAFDRVGRAELALGTVTLVLGAVALALAETAAAEVLLAVFIGAIVVMWAVEMADHAGWMPGHGHPAG
ncbi:MAG TPA: hypothetical protein VFL69_13995 [Marmoricola sp.]|jgi:hypothetical protein|nr:hypothetical protein [Marmoricola sp.]